MAVKVYIRALPEPGRESERMAVRQLVCEALGGDTEVIHNADGSPVVNMPGVKISISHCRTCAVLAVSDVDVGVDVETDRPQLGRVAARVFSPEELSCYSDNLVKAWTLKEALYKAALTPGLDFRRDIKLPLDDSDIATVFTPAQTEFHIVRSEWIDEYQAYMSLVVRL